MTLTTRVFMNSPSLYTHRYHTSMNLIKNNQVIFVCTDTLITVVWFLTRMRPFTSQKSLRQLILKGLSYPLQTYKVKLIVEKLGFFKKGKWIIYIYIIYLHYGNMLSKYKHQNIKTLGAFSHNIVFLYKSYIKK